LPISGFNEITFYSLCDLLSARDADLNKIIQTTGYPPFWNRSPTFSTLIHIILEQQVSLASAKAAMNKLHEKIGEVTPEKILRLTDDELKNCYFSRQKATYARALAQSINDKHLNLEELPSLEDDKVRTHLLKIKGIGNWTAEIFLMMALHRCDCFPAGDIALLKSVREVKGLPATTLKEEIVVLANKWKPYRTIAAYLLWHAYLEKRQRKITVRQMSDITKRSPS
jgi:DNA-3-methyladenine glycosylase II